VTPPGEVRQDWELIQELANRIGLDWSYSHPREIYAEMASMMSSLDNISWDRLEREDAVTYPSSAPDKPGDEIIFSNGFPTASGRARIVPANIEPPAELPDETYPMVLTTGRLLEHWHTGAMTRRAGNLDALEPEAVACLNGRDMDRMGIKPGSPVRVTTRRGQITLTARLDRDVARGMVFIPFCFSEAAANVLTNPQLDPMGKIPEFKFCAAKVEPVEMSAVAAE
jgi:formate dehydrogenase major subunit